MAVLIVNPLRETALFDDWAYARTVEELLRTGEYDLHPWLSANMYAQALWGALFCKVSSYSFAALRLSTLALLPIALYALYRLALEHGISKANAGTLALCMLASPLVLMLSFSFMTDVPFLACMSVGLFAYTRALRLRSWRWMFAAGFAGATAMLVRQFGMALPFGMLLTWLTSRDLRRRAGWIGAGVALPLVTAAWQLYQGSFNSNWGARLSLAVQREYVADLPRLLVNFLWRPAMVLEYAALFALPLILGLVVATPSIRRRLARSPGEARIVRRAALGLTLGLLLAIALGNRALGKPWLMPHLPWNLEPLREVGVAAQLVVTAVVFAAAVALGCVLVLRWASFRQVPLPVEVRFLDAVMLGSLGLHTLFAFIGDEYLLVFLLYALLVLGRALGLELERARPWACASSALILLVTALATRGVLSQSETAWQAAESIRERGVPPAEITSTWTWDAYYLFDDYMEIERARGIPPTKSFEFFFDTWMPERERTARYVVTQDREHLQDGSATLLATLPFRDLLLRRREYLVIERPRPPAGVSR